LKGLQTFKAKKKQVIAVYICPWVDMIEISYSGGNIIWESDQMKIAVPCEGNMLGQHFERSRSLVVVSVKNSRIDSIELFSVESLQQSSYALPDFLAAQEVTAVIAGMIGDSMLNSIKSRGIDVIRGASGPYESVLKQYLMGLLADSEFIFGRDYAASLPNKS
jgi:predicted Fe-Mo cluster-binding NifX family protein